MGGQAPSIADPDRWIMPTRCLEKPPKVNKNGDLAFIASTDGLYYCGRKTGVDEHCFFKGGHQCEACAGDLVDCTSADVVITDEHLDRVLPVRMRPDETQRTSPKDVVVPTHLYTRILFPDVEKELLVPVPFALVTLAQNKGCYVQPTLSQQTTPFAEVKVPQPPSTTQQAMALYTALEQPLPRFLRNVEGHIAWLTDRTYHCGRVIGAVDPSTSVGDARCARRPSNDGVPALACSACKLLNYSPDERPRLGGVWAPVGWTGDDPYVWSSTSGLRSSADYGSVIKARADGIYISLRQAGFVADIAGHITAFSVVVTVVEEVQLRGIHWKPNEPWGT